MHEVFDTIGKKLSELMSARDFHTSSLQAVFGAIQALEKLREELNEGAVPPSVVDSAAESP